MRILSILCVAFFCLSSASFAESVQVKRSPKTERYFKQQEKLKKTYEQRKKQALKQLSKVSFEPLQKTSLPPKTSPQIQSSWERKLLQTKKTMLSGWRSLKNSTLRHWGGIKNQVSRWAEKFQGKKLFSQPPTAGGFDSHLVTSGTLPIIELSTLEEIVDPDGTVETIIWDYGDGTTQTFDASELDDYASVFHIYPAPNHYNTYVTLIDDNNDQTKYFGYVEIGTNEVPLPTFSVDHVSGSTPLTVEFTSTGSDPEGQIDSYGWEFGDGGEEYGKDKDQVQHEYTSSGTYQVEFDLVDAARGFNRAFADIYVGVTPPSYGSRPSIVFTSSDLAGVGPLTVEFDASHSFDIDGTIASYSWDFGDYGSLNNTSTKATPSHTYQTPGTYVVHLVVEDAAGGESEVFYPVFVHDEDNSVKPEVIAFQQSNPLEIEFDGTPTSLRNAVYGFEYRWDFDDGNQDEGLGVTHTYSSGGTYTVTLDVHDIFGNDHHAEREITISTTADAPEVEFSVSPSPAEIFEYVTFDGTGSSDPAQSDDLIFRFDSGSGVQAEDVNEESVDYPYPNPGLYLTELVVTNTRGLSAKANAFITVQDGSVPHAVALMSPLVGSAPLEVGFDGRDSFSENSTISDYYWLSNGQVAFISDHFSHTFDDPGDYWITLFVRDEAGNYDFQDQLIHVVDSSSIPGSNAAPTASFAKTQDTQNLQKYNFDASNSSDSNGDDLFYEWRINGELVSNDKIFDYEFPQTNIYQVSLKVYDEWGATDTDTQQVDLSGASDQQLAFDYAPLKPIVSETVQFGAEYAVVPGSTIVSYDWDFGDSSSGSGVTETHSYASAGTYTVKLTVTDSASNTFSTTQDVDVSASASAPELIVVATDGDLLGMVLNGGTYRATGSRETIHFSVRPTEEANKYIKDATWDFDDGQTGFGADVEYTYTKPGTYTVSVTGKDANGNTDTANLSVVIPEDCKTEDETTECLSFPSLSTNILPFSEGSWVLQRTGNFNTDSKYRPENWITLHSVDGDDTVIDLSEAVSVSNNQITLSKQSLIDMNLDFSKGYKIFVNTQDSSNASISAQSNPVYFGAGQVHVTSAQTGVRLIVAHAGAGFRRFVDLDTATEATFSDLPLGKMAVIAQKDGESLTFTVDLKLHQMGEVAIDFTAERPPQRKLAFQKKASQGFFQTWKEVQLKALKNKLPQSQVGNLSLPSWALGLCGEEPPFRTPTTRLTPLHQTRSLVFSSSDPDAQNSFQDVPVTMTRPLRLSCGISSSSLLYSYNKWKYKDGPERCFGQAHPHWYWEEFLKNVTHEDDPVVIRYEVKDSWTNESYQDVIVTSAKAMRENMGLSLNQITQRSGIVPEEDQEWAYRQDFNIYIPPQFRRPQVKFELISSNETSEEDFYSVQCDVLNSENLTPKVVSLGAVALNDSSDRARRNGQYSLQSRYHGFPIHYDDRTSSAQNADANTVKAKYLVTINYFNQSTITWQGVKVDLTYNGVNHSEEYAFSGTGSNDTLRNLYRNEFTLDMADWEGFFEADLAKDRIQMKITPYGQNASLQTVNAEPYLTDFVALMDVQTIESAQSLSLCGSGYFGSSYSTFATNTTVKNLLSLSNEGVNVRCGDVSLPFGGPFDLSSWTHNGHTDGNTLTARTFNTSGTAQDGYDGSGASLRKSDIVDYMTFSDAALTISEIEDEYDGSMNPTDKKKLYDFCHPTSGTIKYPCTVETEFEDLDFDMILQICQWYSDSGSEIDGCPTGYLTAITRFSSWVMQNADELALAKSLMLHPALSSGEHFDSTAYLPVQKQALVYGLWPDGKPIWALSSSGNELKNERAISCHEKQNGCESLKSLFVNDNAHVETLELKNGWRL